MIVKLLVAYKDGDDLHRKRRLVEFQDEDRATNLCKQRMARKATDDEIKSADDIPVIKASKSKVKPEPKPAPKPEPKPAPKKDE